ncbi:threonine--tRNA ligase, partial [Paramuribaculum intestinale]
MINITFPDNSVKQFEAGVTPLAIAESISSRLAQDILAASVNGQEWDITRPIEEDATIKLFKWDDPEGKHAFWHSSAHLLAEALQALYPGVKFGIGPAVDNGFYYDIDPNGNEITASEFPKIEKKMLELAREKNAIVRADISKSDALKLFGDRGESYKCELISELEDGHITTYTQGGFTDLCRGPHIANTAPIKAVKITSLAGAYWRGDEKREQLIRVYGITFPKQKMLDEYLVMLEEAKKRDHRKLGKEMELFAFSQNVGAGLPLWLPKGAALRDRLEQFLRKIQRRYGYQQVITPHIGNKMLYVTSGHYAKYGKDSFQPIHTPEEGEEYLLKPMNCPHHCEIFRAFPRSYRELPLRLAEFGTVYRYEQSGELHGLTRVRGFTQDDAHIFCAPDQIKDEFLKVMDIIFYIFKALKFENFEAQISLRDPNNKEKYIGSDENWHLAEQAIIEACQEKGLKARTELGEAAFYGPKLDFMVKDALGRRWQLGTIQVDYNLPERFGLEYTGADNQKHRPVMIHRAPFGSMERFVAVLLEHTAGRFPLWLAPDQAVVLPISEKYNDYAFEVARQLNEADVRAIV